MLLFGFFISSFTILCKRLASYVIGKLLLSIENALEVLLLRVSGSIRSQIDQSIWKRAFCSILRGI